MPKYKIQVLSVLCCEDITRMIVQNLLTISVREMTEEQVKALLAFKKIVVTPKR